jgi:hypothetical protein
MNLKSDELRWSRPHCTVHVPHGTYDGRKPAEQERRSKMHALIRLRTIAFRGLARAEHSESCTWHTKLHELAHCQTTIPKAEPALQGIVCILHAVACKVNNARIRQRRDDVRDGGRRRRGSELNDLQPGFARAQRHHANLVFDSVQLHHAGRLVSGSRNQRQPCA